MAIGVGRVAPTGIHRDMTDGMEVRGTGATRDTITITIAPAIPITDTRTITAATGITVRITGLRTCTLIRTSFRPLASV
jgi:hypothetical protein